MNKNLSSIFIVYLVFVSLEEDDGAFELVDVIDRRALVVDGPTLRPWPGSDELIEIDSATRTCVFPIAAQPSRRRRTCYSLRNKSSQ